MLQRLHAYKINYNSFETKDKIKQLLIYFIYLQHLIKQILRNENNSNVNYLLLSSQI